MLCFKLYFMAIFVYVNSQVISNPVVDTSVGTISGIESPEFTSFLGIPYGVVDKNNLFAEATPSPRFYSTYFAHNDPEICPQLVRNVPKGDIHCLNLNIYRPNNITTDSALPVMVFIHGGAFVEGNGNLKTYSPKFLVKNNVIIVSINYRLGVYGFLCIPELNYSNQGLIDQLLAFDWVKNNIEYFGGNNNDITIFGHSAGSIAADIHLLYNENKVFNKVILQSGAAVSPIAFNNNANEKYVRRIVKPLKLKNEEQTTDGFIKELSKIDKNMLINVTGRDVFRPCVDDIYIKKHADMKLKGIKVMIGSAIKEALFLYNNEENENQFFIFLPNESLDKIKKYYFNHNDVKEDAIEFGTDLMFNYPIERSINYYEDNADVVYRYVFTYDGGRNFIKIRDNITSPGATHGDELGYIFDADFLGYEITEADQNVIDSMTKWWTNFAKYGNPEDSWPAIGKESRFYKKIGQTKSTEKNFFKDKIDFWNELYSSYGGCLTGVDYGEEYTCMMNTGNTFSFNLVYGLMFLLAILLNKRIYHL